MKVFFSINDIIYKYDEKKEILIKILNIEECKGGTCLVMNTSKSLEKKSVYTNIYELDTKKEYITRELDRELEKYVYSKIEDNRNLFVFALSLTKYLYFIDGCKFDKVYSLDYLFYKMGVSNNGIISKDVMIIENYTNKNTFISNYITGENNSIYYIGLESNIYINNLKRMLDSGSQAKIFALSPEIKDEIRRINPSALADISTLYRIIKDNDKMYLVDRVSVRYKTNILHKYMYLGDLIFIGLTVALGYFYLLDLSYGGANQDKIDKQTAVISQYNNQIQTLKSKLPNIEYNKYDIDYIKDELSFLNNFDVYDVKYEFNSKQNKMVLNFVIDDIKKIENLIKYLNDNKIQYTYKRVKDFSFGFTVQLKAQYVWN